MKTQKMITFIVAAFFFACIFSTRIHSAAPAHVSSLSSSARLPALTEAQERKVAAFKKTLASTRPSQESIEELIRDGVHPDHIRFDEDRNCALGSCIQFSHNLVFAQTLLQRGANPDGMHDRERMLLHASSVQSAQLLLTHGADIHLCARHLLPSTICYLSQKSPELIPFYIQQGVDPDLTGGIADLHPMISLGNKLIIGAQEHQAARYLIQGGTSLSFKSGLNYTAPQVLKKKLLEEQEIARRHRNKANCC